MYTRVDILNLLDRSNLSVEKAILALYRCQTTREKSTHSTQEHNGKGFSMIHARLGTYYANWILSGKRLSGKHLDKARKISKFYVGQLVDMANKKEKE